MARWRNPDARVAVRWLSWSPPPRRCGRRQGCLAACRNRAPGCVVACAPPPAAGRLSRARRRTTFRRRTPLPCPPRWRCCTLSHLGFDEGIVIRQPHSAAGPVDFRVVGEIWHAESVVQQLVSHNEEQCHESFLNGLHTCMICFSEYTDQGKPTSSDPFVMCTSPGSYERRTILSPGVSLAAISGWALCCENPRQDDA